MALAVTAAQVADMEFVIPRFGEYIYDWERVRNGASGQRRFNALVEDGYGNVMFTAQYEIKSKIQYNAQMTRYWAPAGGWPPMIILNAQEARWQQSPRPGWTYLRGTAIKYDEERNVVSQTSFENDGFFVPLEAKAARVPDYEVKTDISPSKLESEEIDILYRPTLYLIQYMREHGLRADITFDINRRIASPLSNIILLLVGLPFVLKREVKSPFLGMVLAVFITAAYFAASLICENFALEGRVLTPLTGAWAPIIIFAPVGVLLFDTVES
jgi:lipopolysaccharide export LptBFGC system permease protein LptF